MSRIDQWTTSNFDTNLSQSPMPVLIDFWADWCGPCRLVAPVLEQIAEERGDSLRIAKVDVDDSPELAEKFNVVSIPTLVLFRDGKEVGRQVGAYPKAMLDKFLDTHLG